MTVRLLLICALAGCLPNPATGVPSNGQPLRVRYSTGVGSYVSNDVTSTDVHTDSQGNQSTTEHYTPVEHSYRWHDWKYLQGREELDEQDYYRIAGDRDAEKRIADIRASASLKMKIGVPLAVAGLVAATVLGSVGHIGSDSTTALGYVGASVVGGAGALVVYWGASQMKNRHHLPPARADQNADIIEDCADGRCRHQRGGRR
jgi:hypothetical protein